MGYCIRPSFGHVPTPGARVGKVCSRRVSQEGPRLISVPCRTAFLSFQNRNSCSSSQNDGASPVHPESFLSVSVRLKLSGSTLVPPDCHFKEKSVKLANSRENRIAEKMREDSSAAVSQVCQCYASTSPPLQVSVPTRAMDQHETCHQFPGIVGKGNIIISLFPLFSL